MYKSVWFSSYIIQKGNKKTSTSVKFVIYARDKHAAQNAIKLLEQSIESNCDEKTIFSEMIKEFNADQVIKSDSNLHR